jgi:hypothetical protein
MIDEVLARVPAKSVIKKTSKAFPESRRWA